MGDRITDSTETKPGIFTTEFWVTGIFNIVMILQLLGTDWISNLPDKWAALALAGVNGLYAISRGLAKQGSTYYGPVPAQPTLDEGELQPGDLAPPTMPGAVPPGVRPVQ